MRFPFVDCELRFVAPPPRSASNSKQERGSRVDAASLRHRGGSQHVYRTRATESCDGRNHISGARTGPESRTSASDGDRQFSGKRLVSDRLAARRNWARTEDRVGKLAGLAARPSVPAQSSAGARSATIKSGGSGWVHRTCAAGSGLLPNGTSGAWSGCLFQRWRPISRWNTGQCTNETLWRTTRNRGGGAGSSTRNAVTPPRIGLSK